MTVFREKARVVCCVCCRKCNDYSGLLAEKVLLWKRCKQPLECGILIEAKTIRHTDIDRIIIDLLAGTWDNYPLFTNWGDTDWWKEVLAY